ncbi:MAG: hypothetical protein GY953_26610, partial [bacterium]|nr:hypothetical protein [bacterium]
TGFALAIAGFAVALSQWDGGLYWGVFEWFRSSFVDLVVFPAAAVVVLLQFTRRRTAISRIVAASGFLVAVLLYMFVPWEAAFAVQSSLSKQEVGDDIVRFSLARNAAMPAKSQAEREQPTRSIGLPLLVTGLPEGHGAIAERIALTIRTAGGVSQRFTRDERSLAIGRDGQYWRYVPIDEPLHESVIDSAVSAEVSIFVTLYGNLRTSHGAALNDPSVLPDGTLCSPDLDFAPGRLFLSCRSALRGPGRTTVRLQNRATGAVRRSELAMRSSYSPLPADVWLSPLVRDVARFSINSIISKI